jgi:hypothetical protein
VSTRPRAYGELRDVIADLVLVHQAGSINMRLAAMRVALIAANTQSKITS